MPSEIQEKAPKAPFEPGLRAVGDVIGHHHRDTFAIRLGRLGGAVPALGERNGKGIAGRRQERHLRRLFSSRALVGLVEDRSDVPLR